MSLENLDPQLTQPKRLAALGIVANSAEVEFTFLRDVLELSDSDLSKQMAALLAADYVVVRKTGKGRNRKTWYKTTKDGRAAMAGHLEALNSLVRDAPQAPEPINEPVSEPDRGSVR